MIEIEVEIKGTTPLLMNRFRDVEIESKGKKHSGAMADRKIEDKLYLENGKPVIPTIYFRNSIIEGAKQFKITGKGKSTYSKLAGSIISMKEEYAPIQPAEYEEYRVAAVNPMTHGRMMVTRPRFNNWKTHFSIIIGDNSLPASILHDILDYAGQYVGIGDWRPDKKGNFGKYQLTMFKEKE